MTEEYGKLPQETITEFTQDEVEKLTALKEQINNQERDEEFRTAEEARTFIRTSRGIPEGSISKRIQQEHQPLRSAPNDAQKEQLSDNDKFMQELINWRNLLKEKITKDNEAQVYNLEDENDIEDGKEYVRTLNQDGNPLVIKLRVGGRADGGVEMEHTDSLVFFMTNNHALININGQIHQLSIVPFDRKIDETTPSAIGKIKHILNLYLSSKL